MITLASVRGALAAYRAKEENEPGVARAAVALLLAPTGSDLELLFIRRAVRADDPWSGQVAAAPIPRTPTSLPRRCVKHGKRWR